MTKGKPQIIAIGGGSFSAEPDSSALEQYVIRQTKNPRPAVTFIGTASGDAESYTLRFYKSLAKFDCRLSHLPFFARTPKLRDHILQQDIIFVGGGNTKSMLAVWREWELPALLREAWQEGIVLAGVSAGAICWFQQGVTDSWAEKLVALDCLGFLRGSCCPHYDGEAQRRPIYHDLLLKGDISPGFAIEDGAAIHLVDGELHRVVAARPNAKAYRVSVPDGRVKEEALETEYL